MKFQDVFLKALVRYTLHTIKPIHLKCVIQYFLVYSDKYAIITTI